MTDPEYSTLYNRLIGTETFLGSARARSWIRADIREKLLQEVRAIRDELYRIKLREDRAQEAARECGHGMAVYKCPLCSRE